jgi:FkbM family methyltransferase
MNSLLKQAIKGVFSWAGLYLRPRRSLPRGIDLALDLKRHWGTRAPRVIFDVGANLGQTSLGFASEFTKAQIHAFEPVGTTYRRMLRELRSHPRIHPHGFALGAKDGTALIQARPESGSNRLLPGGQGEFSGPVESVPVRRIDAFCAEQGLQHIDLLKTDCEGFDLEVLRGATCLLTTGAIDCIYCEVNLRRDGAHADFFAIEAFLRPLGYAFYALYDYSSWHHDFAREGFANALFIRQSEPAAPAALRE